MKYGVIDIGANTIRINIYNLEDNKLKLIIQKKTTAGLASYVDNNTLSKKGINKLIKTLTRFIKILQYTQTDATYVFATASIRNVENSQEIINEVYEKTSFNVDLLSGEAEAKLVYRGVLEIYSDIENGIIVDIGGGSTEIVILKNKHIKNEISLSEGSLSLYTKFVKGILPTKNEIDKLQNHFLKLLEQSALVKKEITTMIGVGGTIRATGNITSEYFDLDSNIELDSKIIIEMLTKLCKKEKNATRTILQIVPERIHTIIPGMIILSSILTYFNIKEVLISDNGVREGYLLTKVSLEA